MTHILPWLNAERVERLHDALSQRILVLDGAMGTMLQQHELDEAGYRGERFACGCDTQHAHNHAGEQAIRDIVVGEGWSRWRRATETPVNLVYEARP